MPHVPGSALRLGALVGENDLVAGAASRLERLGVMSPAVEPSVPPEVYKIDEQLSADAAYEAGRMPERGRTGSARSDGHLTGRYRLSALATSGSVRSFELTRVTPTESLPFPLTREYPQFSLLLFGQAAAVTRLVVVGRQLLQQLLHPLALTGAAHVRYLVLRKGAEVQVNLE